MSEVEATDALSTFQRVYHSLVNVQPMKICLLLVLHALFEAFGRINSDGALGRDIIPLAHVMTLIATWYYLGGSIIDVAFLAILCLALKETIDYHLATVFTTAYKGANKPPPRQKITPNQEIFQKIPRVGNVKPVNQ